jgi:hypothetical protein
LGLVVRRGRDLPIERREEGSKGKRARPRQGKKAWDCAARGRWRGGPEHRRMAIYQAIVHIVLFTVLVLLN